MFNFQIELPKAPKSNFDLSHVHRFDARPGNITPVLAMEVLPGDKISIDINSLIKTFPLQSPLMGTYKFQYDVFWSPLSNYCRHLNSNNINTKENFNIPCFKLSPRTTGHVSELLHYIGFPQDIDYTDQEDSIVLNALPFLTYWDCFYNYYANQQEKFYPITTFTSTGTIHNKPMLLSDLYNIILFCKDYFASPSVPLSLETVLEDAYTERQYSVYDVLCLFNKTYLRDYFNARLNTNGLSETTSKVTVSNNSFTVNQLRLANSIQKYIDRSSLGGSRYGEIIRSCFGISGPDHLDIPTLLGSVNSYMNFEDVTCTSVGEENTLGQLGGKGLGFLKSNKFTYTAHEYGMILINFSITPVVDYYQGLHRFLTKKTWYDLYNPCFDNIGLQPVYKTEMALPSERDDYEDWANTSIGKLPAWSEYKTAYNRVSGELARSLSYWTNARPVKDSNDSIDMSSYINPAQWSNSFLDSDDTAKNFLVQAKFNILAKRCMSKNPPRL